MGQTRHFHVLLFATDGRKICTSQGSARVLKQYMEKTIECVHLHCSIDRPSRTDGMVTPKMMRYLSHWLATLQTLLWKWTLRQKFKFSRKSKREAPNRWILLLEWRQLKTTCSKFRKHTSLKIAWRNQECRKSNHSKKTLQEQSNHLC